MGLYLSDKSRATAKIKVQTRQEGLKVGFKLLCVTSHANPTWAQTGIVKPDKVSTRQQWR